MGTVDISGIYGGKSVTEDEQKQQQQQNEQQLPNGGGSNQQMAVSSAQNAHNSFDEESSSFITLQSSKQSILALRQVGRHCALVCIMKKSKNKGLLEYNIKCFKQSMKELFVLLKKIDN